MPAAKLRVGGFSPFSTVDWPDALTATVFTQGCPWDCPYCHNPHLLRSQSSEVQPALAWEDVCGLLARRVGLLDAVVFSGGEPTVQEALPAAMDEVAELGFRVALHTNGVRPDRLSVLLPRLSWVGLDIKAPFELYERITGVPGSGIPARESLEAVLASGVDFEVRTTVHPELLGADDLKAMAEQLRRAGVRRWVLQAYRALGVRPGLGSSRALDEAQLREMLGDAVSELVVRA